MVRAPNTSYLVCLSNKKSYNCGKNIEYGVNCSLILAVQHPKAPGSCIFISIFPEFFSE